jgi:large conductance mechanosensitive channel
MDQPVTPIPEKKSTLAGFLEFIREQGVIGLAVGFILGGAVSKVVTALITDIVNPLLGIALGSAKGLKDAKIKIASTEILWGDFLSVVIDFAVISLVVYVGVKIIGVDRLDKKKS